MNVYRNFCDDATIYAILQSLSPLNRDLKEEIVVRFILNIIDDYLLNMINENILIPDDINNPHDMWNNMSDDDNEWWIN